MFGVLKGVLLSRLFLNLALAEDLGAVAMSNARFQDAPAHTQFRSGQVR